MKTLYITSAEVYSGKSALCVGLGVRFRKDGLKIGYMKPVNLNCQVREGIPYDEDVDFARKVFELKSPWELISPVALTPTKFQHLLQGPEPDFGPRLEEAFAKASQGCDVMILEGGRSLREGYVAGLQPRKVVEMLGARVIMIMRFDETLMVDRALAGQIYFGKPVLGLVINEVPRNQIDFVRNVTVPYFVRHGLPVFGALPTDPVLTAPSVAELASGLCAEILCSSEGADKLVEHMLVGAMSVDSALHYFRRKPNKAVVTGGDRADIQLAALETSTRALILTGGIYPSPAVLNRAEELSVPVLLTKLDTVNAIEIAEDFFGQSRFQQPQKVERFSALLEEHLDFAALYHELGITSK